MNDAALFYPLIIVVRLSELGLRVEIGALDVLEVAVSADFELFAGSVIGYDNSLGCICRAEIVHIWLIPPSTP